MSNITWLKPDQIDELRNACYSDSFQAYTQARNDAIIALFADTGLRSNELRQLRETHFQADERKLFVPKEIQKQFFEGEPKPATLELKPDTARTLRSYLKSREKESEYLFPSRQRPFMTTRALRAMVDAVAHEADVRPVVLDSERGWIDGEPSDVSTHTFRHSVAYRMLEVEEGNDIYDVMKRLRHKNIQTTINTYSHFETV